MDGIKKLFMIFNMEKFGELISPESNRLSEGMQLIVEKLQETEGEGVRVFENKECLDGMKREVELLKTFYESSPGQRVIEISKLLGETIVENPERL